MTEEKIDGQCLAPSCEAKVDWSKWDKPPPGWATLTYDRYTKKGSKAHQTFLLCPDHTINFVRRQTPIARTAPPDKFKRIIIESPFSGMTNEDVARNQKYLRAAMRDAILKGEAPFSHGLYTQEGVLNDRNPEERKLGMEAGFTWIQTAESSIAYEDLGVSRDMIEGLRRAEILGKPIERRKIVGWKR